LGVGAARSEGRGLDTWHFLAVFAVFRSELSAIDLSFPPGILGFALFGEGKKQPDPGCSAAVSRCFLEKQQ
jgi:hypothetical protein